MSPVGLGKRAFSSMRLWRALLGSALLSLLAIWVVAEVGTRRVGLAVANIGYSISDFTSDRPTPRLGPGAVPQNSLKTVEMVKQQFPDFVVESSVLPPCSYRPTFWHELCDHPRMHEFLNATESYRVDSSLFDLSERVRSLAPHRVEALPDVGTDPLAYLRFAEQGKGLTCRYFAVIYGAMANAQGYTSRLLGLSKTGSSYHHAACEVYVPEFGKWILVDPDFNIAYRSREGWLNAHEIHQIWMAIKKQSQRATLEDIRTEVAKKKGKLSQEFGIQAVILGPSGDELRRKNMASGCTGMNLEFFEYVFYHVGNDFLTQKYPPGHYARSTQYVLQSTLNQSPPPICPEGIVLSDLSDVYWSVGRTDISLVEHSFEDGLALIVSLGTYTPNFDFFEICLDGSEDTEWTRCDGSKFTWRLDDGTNQLRVRSVNQAGLRGEVSMLSVHWGD